MILQYFYNNSQKLITGDLEKHFGIPSSYIRTRRFGENMSPLSNIDYCKFKKRFKNNIGLLEGNLVISGNYLRSEGGPFEIAEDVPYEIF